MLKSRGEKVEAQKAVVAMTDCPRCGQPMVPKKRTPFVYSTYKLVWDYLRHEGTDKTTAEILAHFKPTAPRHTQNILSWLRKHHYAANPQQGYWKAI